jgi:hypothetical protein
MVSNEAVKAVFKDAGLVDMSPLWKVMCDSMVRRPLRRGKGGDRAVGRWMDVAGCNVGFNTEVMQILRKFFFEDCSRRKWLEDCAVRTWQHASIWRNVWDKEYENYE